MVIDKEQMDREKEEIRDFIFGNNEQIDIDALESYIINNRETLVNEETSLNIDLSQMMQEK